MFSHATSDDVINEAIEQIEHEGDSWVPSSSRRIPPDDDFDEPPVEYLHSRMRRQVEELEALLKEEPQPTPGIGHNRPPEEFELSPFKDEEKRELSEALEVLKHEPPSPENPAAAQTAVATLKSKAKKLLEWTGDQAKVFAEEAIKEAGKQTGKWTPPVFWAVVLEHVLGITQRAEVWIKALIALVGLDRRPHHLGRLLVLRIEHNRGHDAAPKVGIPQRGRGIGALAPPTHPLLPAHMRSPGSLLACFTQAAN